MEKLLEKYLNEHKIAYIKHLHPAVFTVVESNSVIKNFHGVRAKNLFLKDDSKNFYLVCLPVDKRLNMKQLQIYLGVPKLHFGSPEELKSELNVTPGSVSIFCMIYSNSVCLIVDQSIYNADIVGFHPNLNTATLELSHNDFLKFFNSLKCKKQVLELK